MFRAAESRPPRAVIRALVLIGPTARARRWVRSVCAVTAFAAVAGASSAHAGSYVIDNCPSAPAHNGDSGPWVVFGSPQSSKGSCGGGEGDWIGPRGGAMSANVLDGVRVTVPSGSDASIREAKIWWYVPQQSWGATTFALASGSGGIVGESTTPLEQRGAPSVFSLPSSTSSLTLADYCSNDDAGQGCGFGIGENPNLQLFGSRLTLEDWKLPTGNVTGGGLTGTGSLTGTQSLAYHAEETDSGVRQVRLVIDGRVVAENDYAAICSYANFAACPVSESDVISCNTASLTDGQHRLELTVQDAAGNTAVIYAGTITTQNAPAQLASSVAAPLISGGSAVPNGSGGAQGAQLHLDGSHDLFRTFGHRAVTLTGRLTDAQGQAIGGATLDVREQAQSNASPAQGSSPVVIASVTTDRNGSFTAHLAAGPSRLILLDYRAFSSDRAYTAQTSVLETVSAGVRMQITPRRTSSTGTITIAGQVAGPVPRQGVVVELLVHYRGRWEPFRDPRTDQGGRFRIHYQFEGAQGRFPFRAEVLGGQSGFPYGTGASTAVAVRTR